MSLIRFFWGLFNWSMFCCFGGDSGSSSSVTNQTSNIDRRVVNEAGAIGVTADNSTISVNVTDQGSVAAASEIATHAIDETAASFAQLLSSASDATRAQLQGFQSLVSAHSAEADTSERSRLQGFQSLLDAGKAQNDIEVRSLSDVLGLAKGVLSVESQQSAQTSDIVKTAAQSANTSAATLDLVKYIVVAAALVAGAFVFRGAAA